MADTLFLGGMTNTKIYEESDGTMIAEESQDCQSILDMNQRKRDHRFSAASPEGFVHEVANIPMVPYLDECRKANVKPFSKEADVVMEAMLANPKYFGFLSAPKVRDPHVIIKGVR
jgi:hypothetical protein